MSLATKYRPKTLGEIVSQQSIVKILTRQIETNQVKNAYLFSGASGCGKTTAGRAFANAINHNQGSPIEIDGASNNGVDNIKSIIKSASERALDSEYKIYIIDEAHALTNASWQALLKTIEEPPMYTIFIFCTTDPQKIPATILNRVMRFNFNRISSKQIQERLIYICQQEGYTNYEEACDYISRVCNGEMRLAISYLEKCADYDKNVTIENALQAIGSYSYESFFTLINSLVDAKENDVLASVEDLYNSGNDMKLFVEQFLSFCLDLNKYALFKDYHLTQIPSSMQEKLNYSVGFDNAPAYYSYIVDKLLSLKNMLKNDNNPKTTIDVVFLQMCRLV